MQMMLRMRARASHLVIFCVLCLSTQASRGEVVDWLYSVQVPVLSQSAADRRAAGEQALLQVVSRVSGQREIADSRRLRVASAQADAYYTQFSYQRDPSGDGLLASFEFDPDAVIGLCRDLELPVWWANRPRVLVLAVNPAGDVIGAPAGPAGAASAAASTSASPATAAAPLPGPAFAAAVLQRARERGIPLVFPEADVDGYVDASAAQVQRYEETALTPLASRYQAEVMTAGALRAGSGRYAGEWRVWLDGEAAAIRARGPDAASVGVSLADQLADQLAQRFAVQGVLGELQLSVTGVVSPRQYAQLLGYLESLEFVDAAAVTGLRDGVFYLQLATQATPEKLLELFAIDGYLGPADLGVSRLTLDPFANAAAEAATTTAGPADLATRWLGAGDS